MSNRSMLFLFVTGLAVMLTFGVAPARAQGFVSPFIGYDFGGDSGCPELRGCEDKKLNAGASVGTLGSMLGFELEFAYAKNFFGEAPGFASSVLTLMGNVMVGPKIVVVQPYVVGGLGLIKSHVELTPTDIFTTDNNHFGWDLGGGLFIMPSSHVGVRGDIRYFHAFQDLVVPGLTLGNTKLDFGRASAALVLKF